MSNPQDLNRYSYVLNNPLKYTDPSGHQVVLPPDVPVVTDLLPPEDTTVVTDPAPTDLDDPVVNTPGPEDGVPSIPSTGPDTGGSEVTDALPSSSGDRADKDSNKSKETSKNKGKEQEEPKKERRPHPPARRDRSNTDTLTVLRKAAQCGILDVEEPPTTRQETDNGQQFRIIHPTVRHRGAALPRRGNDMRPKNWSSGNVSLLGLGLGLVPGHLEHQRGEVSKAAVGANRVVLLLKGAEPHPGLGQ